MTVQELIRELEGHPEDAVVRLAFQPSWPLQYNVGDVQQADGPDFDIYEVDGDWYVSEGEEGDVGGPYPSRDEAVSEMEKMAAAEKDEQGDTVYIAEGGQVYDSPYLPGAVSKSLGWR